MEKLLTIVVPVYNTEKYLPHCLTSLVVPQYMEQLEVLVVIDGSPDNSAKIAKEYQVKYPQTFVVIEKENGGHGSAINKGLELAHGKYFRVLDSDDWFDENNFESFLDSLTIETEELIMTHIIREYVSENRSVLWRDKKIEFKYNARYTDLTILDYLPFDFFAMARCTYKTSRLKEYNLFLLEHRSFEEAFLHIFPLLFIESFVFYDKVIYHYFLGRPNQSVRQKVTIKQCNDWRALAKQMIDFYLCNKNKLSAEKHSFVLRALKQYLNAIYLTLNRLPYREAQRELHSYNSYITTLPFYPTIKGLKSTCYNIIPYWVFRTGYSAYVKFRRLLCK